MSHESATDKWAHCVGCDILLDEVSRNTVEDRDGYYCESCAQDEIDAQNWKEESCEKRRREAIESLRALLIPYGLAVADISLASGGARVVQLEALAQRLRRP
jgi:hypothetical protein